MGAPWEKYTQQSAGAAPAPLVIGTPHQPPQQPPSGYYKPEEGKPAPKLAPIPGGPADPAKDQGTIGASNLSGDAYLKTLDAPTANMVKALSEGRKAFPAGSALKAPYWQDMLAHVANFDPGFDEVNYTSRSATRRDFTSGKAANNIRALNTAIGHLGHLDEQIGGTASHGFTPLNAVENAGRRIMGDPGPTNFDATVSALAGELTAVYRGSGGAEADINRYIQQLNPNASKEQKEGTIRNIVGLLKSRLDALNDQYRQGMGTTAQQLQLLDPQAQLIVQHLGGFDAAGTPQEAGGPTLSGAPPGSPPSAPPPVNPIAGGGDGETGPTIIPSGGQTRAVIDPKQQALGGKIVDLMSRGADRNTILGFAVRSSPKLRSDPKFRAWIDSALAYRAKHPGAKFSVDPEFYTTEVPLSDAGIIPGTSILSERDLNNAAQTAPAAVGTGALNGLTAGNLPAITGALGGDRQAADRAMSVLRAQHPGETLAGEVGGGVATGLGMEGLLGKLGMADGLSRSALTDMTYGAAANPQHPIEGAGLGLAGSLGGNFLGRAGSSVLSGVTNPAASYVAREVPGALTIGQAVGGKLKGIEDSLSGIRIVGDTINARRLEGLQKMNSAAFNRALEPIGGKIDGKYGEEAVAHAQDQVSQAYENALGGKSAHIDMPFIVAGAKAKRALDKLPDGAAADVEKLVDGVMNDHFSDTGQLTGENLQAALQELASIKAGYHGTPAANRIGKVLDEFSNSLETLFSRQAPEVMPAYNAAKKAQQRLYTLREAVLKAKNESKDGQAIFTTGQLGLADRASTIAYGGRTKAASGGGEFHDFQRNMQEVLPNKIPDSGTAGRLLVPLALLGASGGGGALEGETGKGLTLGAMLALAYTKTGQRALTAAVLKRGIAARAAGRAVRKAAPALGHGGAASAALGSPSDD